ncbi:hypothetical protein [Streptomyces sp. NPDC006368]|uniref:hypothetical protein n=1 Tax=Streptomyces sp. NPDC006368 TaxID=3156760 RepID=UPI0033A3B36C
MATQRRERYEREEHQERRELWVEEPATRRRLPDPVRRAAVRAVLIASLTLIQAMVAFFSTLAGSWLAFPTVISSVAGTMLSTWAAADVWVTRQVWNQRHGVVSMPSSTARQLRRERRRARRVARAEARASYGAGAYRTGPYRTASEPDGANGGVYDAHGGREVPGERDAREAGRIRQRGDEAHGRRERRGAGTLSQA